MSALTTPRRANLSAALAEMRLRLITVSRYPGQLLLEILLPILFAAMPIFLSQALPGGGALRNFEANTGTASVEIFLLIGSTAYILVTRAFWDIAYWLRYEQQTGTLESLYLTPTSTRVLLLGVVGYSATRSLFSSALAFALGCLLFQVNPLQGNLLVAWLFILVGLVPVYALALLFGAVVVRVRESNALVSLVQWGVAFVMGVYYPIKMLPPLLQGVSLIFPPTWLLNGVRSSLLGIGFFLSEWYLDLAVLWAFLLVTPLLSLWAFRAVEERARRHQGLGQY